MIYNTRNRSNDATESQELKEPVLMLILVKSFKKESRDYLRCDHSKA